MGEQNTMTEDKVDELLRDLRVVMLAAGSVQVSISRGTDKAKPDQPGSILGVQIRLDQAPPFAGW